MPQSTKPTKNYDASYDRYMQDVEKYLGEVRGNQRYFTPQDSYAPRFSQSREDGFFKNPPPTQVLQQGFPTPEEEALQQPSLSPFDFIGPAGAMLGRGAAGLATRLGSRFPGLMAERGSFSPIPRFGQAHGPLKPQLDPRDPGGFHVPTRKMLMDDPHMADRYNIQNMPKLWENENRADYLFGRRIENELAEDMRSGSPLVQRAAEERYQSLDPAGRRVMNQVLGGRRALRDEVERGMMSGSGGRKPTAADARLFGYKGD